MQTSINFLDNYDFGSLTGYKTKGLVRYYKQTSSKQELIEIIKYATKHNLPIVACGGGSNILIKDVFNGVFVFYSSSVIEKTSEISTHVFVSADAGVSKKELVKYCSRYGYSGLEFWSGIPGFTGGGVAMNCGAYSSQTQDCVHEIELYSANGVYCVSAKNMKWAYRSSGFSTGDVITSCVFKLKKDDPKKVKTLSLEYIKDREEKHPLEYPSCGSVFKNPSVSLEGCTKGAWELIRDAGLSGFKVGGAMVSPKHTNFIINSGGANPSDVIKLIEEIKIKVKQKFNIQLHEEVKIL